MGRTFVPIGSVEAHGPHLPVETDTLIAQALAHRLAAATGGGVAPPMTRAVCSFAAGLPGTRDVPVGEAAAALRDAIASAGSEAVLVNLHFDPGHMRVLRAVTAETGARFVDFTRRVHAQRIGGEFATGSCHGGEFETSLMMVAAPDRVGALFRRLPEVHVDLPGAIRAGKGGFLELGMVQGYCGRPASASRAEGERLFQVLTQITLEELERASS